MHESRSKRNRSISIIELVTFYRLPNDVFQSMIQGWLDNFFFVFGYGRRVILGSIEYRVYNSGVFHFFFSSTSKGSFHTAGNHSLSGRYFEKS
jgi:hypothetical protein